MLQQLSFSSDPECVLHCLLTHISSTSAPFDFQTIAALKLVSLGINKSVLANAMCSARTQHVVTRLVEGGYKRREHAERASRIIQACAMLFRSRSHEAPTNEVARQWKTRLESQLIDYNCSQDPKEAYEERYAEDIRDATRLACALGARSNRPVTFTTLKKLLLKEKNSEFAVPKTILIALTAKLNAPLDLPSLRL